MNFMKIVFLSAAALAVIIPTASYANDDAASWSGLSVQAGAGYRATTVEPHALNLTGSIVTDGAPIPFDINGSQTSRATSEDAFATFAVGYTLAVNSKFVVTVGGEFTPGFSTSDAVSSTFAPIPRSGGLDPHQFAPISWQYRSGNSYGAFIAPGYAVSSTDLAYLKAGYSRQKVHLETTGGFGLGQQNVGGLLVGAGYKKVIGGGVYAFGEASASFYKRANFSKSIPVASNILVDDSFTLAANPKSHTTSMVLGLGYRF